jgi:hypothetical protein
MKRLVSLLALLLPLVAMARPLLIPPRHLQLPMPAEPQYEGQYSHNYYDVAIDGDVLLVSGQRTIDTNENTINGVCVFRRAADGGWNHAGPRDLRRRAPVLARADHQPGGERALLGNGV